MSTGVKIPPHVCAQYDDGARGFKSAKRQQVRAAIKMVKELRMGCAYFPLDGEPVPQILEDLEQLRVALSVANWGRR